MLTRGTAGEGDVSGSLSERLARHRNSTFRIASCNFQIGGEKHFHHLQALLAAWVIRVARAEHPSSPSNNVLQDVSCFLEVNESRTPSGTELAYIDTLAN